MPKTTVIDANVIRQPFWTMTEKEVLHALKVSLNGLSEIEAGRRQNIFGSNVIEDNRRLTKLRIVLNQFKSPLISILLGAGVITLFLREWIDAGAIFATVLINVGLGFWQENKAETVLEHLKSYVRTRARVRREGRMYEIDATELVPGDVIHLAQGDRVPADARVVFANALEIDEAILTGESLPVEKFPEPVSMSAAIGDRGSALLGGTLVVQGFADAVVTATGAATEFGRIAKLAVAKAPEQTPLQRAVSRFVVTSGLVLAVLILALFLYGLAIGQNPLDIFLLTVAVAVSAIPEGLPISLTVILAVGVERLARRKGIVRRLLATESLGGATIILTDKTGTLTQAKLLLTALLPSPGADDERLLNYAVANTDVLIENPSDKPKNWRLNGKPLETALVRAAGERGLAAHFRILDRLPFDSTRKFSAALVQEKQDTTLAVLGAPEILLEATTLSPSEKAKWRHEIDLRASKGERVLGVIAKPAREGEKISAQLSKAFYFIGLISFRDPLRPGVAEAIKRIAMRGVRTIIVTGDHSGTAQAVAKELGLINGKGSVMTGQELALLSEHELLGRLPEISVFARVSPEQKLNIARLFQLRGETVAVTGDGVNDAPALRQADIGVAVGSGTDVAKSTADLIILDDNFETLVVAIEEGRRILSNVKKAIIYLLSDALDELFLIGGALITGVAIPLSALQILYVNLFSDSLPAIAFAFETRTDDTKHRPDARLLDGETKFLILIVGVVTSALLFVLYLTLLRLGIDPSLVRTFIFASFASYTLIVAFALRDLTTSILRYNPFSNIPLTLGVGLGLVLTLVAVYVPFMNHALSTIPLPYPWLLGVAAVALINVLAIEIVKRVYRARL